MLHYHSKKLKLKRPTLSTPLVRLVLLGLGALKCRFPGMVRCSKARQTLMSAAQQHKPPSGAPAYSERDSDLPTHQLSSGRGLSARLKGSSLDDSGCFAQSLIHYVSGCPHHSIDIS